MSEYDVLLGDDTRNFLEVADDKTERVCTEKLRYLAENPYPGRGRGDKEKRPIDGRRDRFRMHISRSYTAIYTILEDQSEVRVLEIVTIDEAHTAGCNSMKNFDTPGCRISSRTYSQQYHKRYGF